MVPCMHEKKYFIILLSPHFKTSVAVMKSFCWAGVTVWPLLFRQFLRARGHFSEFVLSARVMGEST